MIEIEEKAVPVIVDIKGGEVTANITPAHDVSVTVGESAALDATAAVNYIKSGEAEINAHTTAKIAEYDANAEVKKAEVNTLVDEAAANVTLARQWANKTSGTVDGLEYSAKHYAEQASATLNDRANLDLSNLSATGEAKFDAKQDELVSGTNIKTVNNQSLLGSGNITISGGANYTAGDFIDITNDVIAAKGSTDSTLGMETWTTWALFDANSTQSATLYNRDNDLVNAYNTGQTVFVEFLNSQTGAECNIISLTSNSYEFNITLEAVNTGTQYTYTGYYYTESEVLIDSSSDEVLPTQKAVKTYVDDVDNTLQNAIAGKADDSTVVRLTGAQTINGYKEFTQNLVRNNGNLTKGTNPSNNTWTSLEFTDTNGRGTANRSGVVETKVDTNGLVSTYIAAYKWEANSTTYANISVFYPTSGSPYTYAPAPTDAYSATSGTQIGTTGWIATNFVNLAGAQTITGAKTFDSITVQKIPGAVGTDYMTRFASGATLSSADYPKPFRITDKNGVVLSILGYTAYNWGKTVLSLSCNNYVDTSKSGKIALSVEQSGTTYVEIEAHLRPDTDNTYNLGSSSQRWKQLYAGTTTISTSDERYKQGIEGVPDTVLDAWGEVEFYRYKFNDSVAEKGFEKARYHTGMVAQRIENVFKTNGLNAFDYGLLCFDEWEAEPAEYDEAGEIIRPAVEADNRYSLRYEECLCMEAAYQRRRADRIEKRLNALEARAE